VLAGEGSAGEAAGLLLISTMALGATAGES